MLLMGLKSACWLGHYITLIPLVGNHGAARSEYLSCWNTYDGIPLWNNETWPFQIFAFTLHHDPCYVKNRRNTTVYQRAPAHSAFNNVLDVFSAWWFNLCCLKLSIYAPRLIIWICVTIHLNKIECYCCVISPKQIPDPIQVILIDFITEHVWENSGFKCHLQLSKQSELSTGRCIGHCWFIYHLFILYAVNSFWFLHEPKNVLITSIT